MKSLVTTPDIKAKQGELAEAGVEYLFGAYVDILGVPKSKCVPIGHFGSMIKGSELYTVGALEGMGPLGPNEDECVGMPDLASLTILPWNRRYAVIAADLLWHGQPYSHDSRWILKKQIEAAAAMGLRINMGVEPELYVLRPVDGNWQPFSPDDQLNAPTRGYDLEATMRADAFLEPMVKYINELGWDVYSFDHEGGDGQYEFDFAYTDALSMADRMLIFRLMAKHVARTLGCIATFMPKPWPDAFGSGAHYNISVANSKTGENLFAGSAESVSAGDRGYSDVAYHFTAGVLRHAEAITAVTCPTVNSYKRLEPYGRMREMSWAPVYRAYGHNNRTLMCRLPMSRRCLELRAADSGCNFYLGAAMAVAAGLDGIRRKLDPGEPVEFNTYDPASQAELARLGVVRLPRTLGDAIEAFAQDELALSTFGEAFHKSYVEYKRREWNDYCLEVTDWERKRYLHQW
ncbi:MAG TPA: type III glutamate--ammonia ligase [Alphaproteobacteria bacterium]|nr:type III glutamate--ammonia ligase [Alphaproteobacteria bacterium]